MFFFKRGLQTVLGSKQTLGHAPSIANHNDLPTKAIKKALQNPPNNILVALAMPVILSDLPTFIVFCEM